MTQVPNLAVHPCSFLCCWTFCSQWSLTDNGCISMTSPRLSLKLPKQKTAASSPSLSGKIFLLLDVVAKRTEKTLKWGAMRPHRHLRFLGWSSPPLIEEEIGPLTRNFMFKYSVSLSGGHTVFQIYKICQSKRAYATAFQH